MIREAGNSGGPMAHHRTLINVWLMMKGQLSGRCDFKYSVLKELNESLCHLARKSFFYLRKRDEDRVPNV